MAKIAKHGEAAGAGLHPREACFIEGFSVRTHPAPWDEEPEEEVVELP